MTDWDELIDDVVCEAKNWFYDDAPLNEAVSALRSAIAELEDTSKDDNDHLERIVSLAQKYQPAGSPPPGDAHILISWILRSLKDRADKAEQERDNLKTVLHGNQDADYDKQLQIETLKSQLAEAEADAEHLADAITWLDEKTDPCKLALELHRARKEGK